MTYDKCVFTGYKLNPDQINPSTGPFFEYENDFVGKVKITLSVYSDLEKMGNFRYIIAGLCKHRTMNNQEPFLIDSEFIRRGYLSLKPPVEFEEKCRTFLMTLYEMGGKENRKFNLKSFEDFALAYASQEEFTRIVDKLENDYLISIDNKPAPAGQNEFYFGLKLTSYGIEEVKKDLPKIPLYGLVNQYITTGDLEIDNQINHARGLFFSENPTIEKMRSACETLSYVLEPLRKDLTKYFVQKDVNAFFQIVNNFDIRHNNTFTAQLVNEEQLEWVFYTLLNTINTYTKLKQKYID
jgi:hypothetical protein